MKRTMMLFVFISLATMLATAAEREKLTSQDVFDAMRENFQPAKAQGVHARYQFDITGANGGLWWIEVNDGKCKMGRGCIENPNLTLSVSDRDWLAISNDKLSGLWATLTGRLKLRGDRALARKLDEMFP